MTEVKDCYLFIGPPGSGKGSLAQLCIEMLGWRQLSTGNLCRKHISDGTKIGKEIDFLIKSGKLIPDELMSSMVIEWLEQQLNNMTTIILDGYPRTRRQAKALNVVLDRLKRWHLRVIKLLIDDDLALNRLAHRFVCKNKTCQAVYSLDPACDVLEGEDRTCHVCKGPLQRRKDDRPDAIRKRIDIYHKHERDLIKFYQNEGQSVVELDVARPLPEVFKSFKCIAGIDTAL